MLRKVVYNGDYLAVEEVYWLRPELNRLGLVQVEDDMRWLVEEFEREMRELVTAALLVGTAIVFQRYETNRGLW